MALYNHPNQGLSYEFLLPLFEVLRLSLLLASGSIIAKDLGSRDRGDGEPSQVSLPHCFKWRISLLSQ